MKKLDLTGWAALSEIAGTVAVVISLIFVAVGINRNNAELRASNDNFLIQLADERFRDVALDAGLASIVVRFARQDELTEIEIWRYQSHLARMVNMWEVAFVRHRNGLIETSDWEAWDRSFALGFPERYPQEWWSTWRHGYDSDFASHVDAVYAGK